MIFLEKLAGTGADKPQSLHFEEKSMADGLEYRLTSINVLPAPAPAEPEEAGIPWGIRLHPSLRLNLADFFTEFRLEGGAAKAGRTPIGLNYFESNPSGSLSDRSPLGAWVYEPKDDQDQLRANFGIRTLRFGYRLNPDVQFSFGRHRYEQTESDRLFMANAFSPQAKFAELSLPLHWLGGELRYDRQREAETVRQLLVSGAVQYGADSTVLGMGQFLTALAFAKGPKAPLLTLAAYAGVRSNPQPEEGPPLADPGMTHGEGFGLTLDYGIFTGGIAYGRLFGSSRDDTGSESTGERGVGTLLLDVHPGDFRFRGALSFLSRADAEDATSAPPSGQNETHTELTVGYQPVKGLNLALGYRGAYGQEDFATHMGFLGVQTSFKGEIPFASEPR